MGGIALYIIVTFHSLDREITLSISIQALSFSPIWEEEVPTMGLDEGAANTSSILPMVNC